nr:PqqD family peptide modification chaperone [Streptomyces sp. REN17]
MLDERSGRYRQMNTTGARVLHPLLAGHTPHTVADQLTAAHQAAPAQVAADIEVLLAQLAAAGLTEQDTVR